MDSQANKDEMRARLLKALEAITDEEEAAINAGIAADPDNPELTEEDFARMRPHAEVMREAEARRRGRPRQEQVKESVTMRVDADVLEAWRATGPGWQSRMNDTLRRAIGL